MTARSVASLTLEVTGPQAEELGTARRKVFGTEGGTIGRSPGNDWVLADPYVSGQHASIDFHDGTFFIDDLNSRNGVFVNDTRLEPGRPHALQAADRVFIEPYEMVTSMLAGPGQPLARTAVGETASGQVVPPAASPSLDLRDLVEPDAGAADNWLERLAPREDNRRRGEDSNVARVSADPLHQAVAPPVPRSLPSLAPVIPEGYDPLDDSHWKSGPNADPFVPASGSSAAPAGGGDRRYAERRRRGSEPLAAAPARDGTTVDLRALLAGAGLEGVPVSPEVAEQLGQILRVVVEGLLDVLKSRQEIKDEFRIRHTVMKRRGNNPLKFAADVEDALHNLLVKKNPGYLGPVAAFEDAFSDVRHHQLAMLAGVRDAFEHMFAQFHPDRLQQEFNRHTPRRGGLLQSKPDYWEFYRDFVQRLANDPDESFRTLFGDEFAKAYEKQLDGLKVGADAGKARGPGRGAQER